MYTNLYGTGKAENDYLLLQWLAHLRQGLGSFEPVQSADKPSIFHTLVHLRQCKKIRNGLIMPFAGFMYF